MYEQRSPHPPHPSQMVPFLWPLVGASASQQQSHMGGVCNPSSRSTRSTCVTRPRTFGGSSTSSTWWAQPVPQVKHRNSWDFWMFTQAKNGMYNNVIILYIYNRC